MWVLEKCVDTASFHVQPLDVAVRANAKALAEGRKLRWVPVHVAETNDECLEMAEAFRRAGHA